MSSPTLPRIRFDTSNVPVSDQFDAWRDAVGVTHEITSPGRVERSGLAASSDVWRLGEMVISYRCFPPLQFARPNRRAHVDGLDHCSLVLMCEGSWGGDVDGTEVVINPGQVCMFDLARPVDNWVSQNASPRVLLPREQLDAAMPSGALHGLVVNGGAGGLLAGYLRVLLNQLGDLTVAEAPHVARATRDMMAACLMPSRERMEVAAPHIALTQLTAARRYIEANLTRGDLDPADIRRALGLSRSALYWLFEPYGGVAAYLLERRLARVRALLADRREHRRISELAFAHGFASEAHFSRAFRRCFGLTPSDVRGTAERPEPKGPTEAGPTYRAWVRRGQSC